MSSRDSHDIPSKYWNAKQHPATGERRRSQTFLRRCPVNWSRQAHFNIPKSKYKYTWKSLRIRIATPNSHVSRFIRRFFFKGSCCPQFPLASRIPHHGLAAIHEASPSLAAHDALPVRNHRPSAGSPTPTAGQCHGPMATWGPGDPLKNPTPHNQRKEMAHRNDFFVPKVLWFAVVNLSSAFFF